MNYLRYISQMFPIILALLMSCENNSKNELESHFENVTESLGQQKLDVVKSTPNDSTGILFDLIYPEMKYEFEKIKSESTMYLISNDVSSIISDKTKIEYFIICYNLYMHNKRVNLNVMIDIRNRINSYYDKIYYIQKRENETLLSNKNNLIFKIGDTVNLVLPLDDNSTTYLGGIFPDYKYYPSRNTVGIGGVITNKGYNDFYPPGPGGKDSLEPVFDIRLLQISKDVEIFGVAKSVGDTFELNVYHYFRPIESGL